MIEEELMLQQLFDEDKLTDKQKKIITAAIETFSEKGYAASSTSEIAKKAGVAEGTIFRHYKTKKDLLVSIVAPLMTKFIAPLVVKDFNKVLDREYETVEEFLRATIENRRDLLIRMLPVVKIMLQEIPFQPELRAQFFDLVVKNIFNSVEKVIKGYQEKGLLIDMPPESIARLTITNILGFLFSRYILFPQLEWDDELEIERTIQFIMHGLGKKD
ncbi:AcrR family transcriptional regulator [Bacillus niacini]|jgi:AcrR family transcriptional regulator|uniref:AcrR family transcriptional regulator n=1 Tax=Neobacillus niacini TaxID=86668 RepID=A0A852TNP2_9BACI|nr:TetR/AcrR family transcriptional regulator [Neobacillus niacini]NYE09057.1 AcrR family transcriptional regulator [Neobacillus niacini]